MRIHYKSVFQNAPSGVAKLSLRFTGWLFLFLNLVLCVNHWGLGIGSMIFFGELSVASFSVGMSYTALNSLLAKRESAPSFKSALGY